MSKVELLIGKLLGAVEALLLAGVPADRIRDLVEQEIAAFDTDE